MRALTAFAALLALLSGCASAPVRWAGEARLVVDPSPSADALEACVLPDQRDAGDRQGAGESAPAREAAAGRAPILQITSGPREVAAPPLPPAPDKALEAYYGVLAKLAKSPADFLSAARPSAAAPANLDYTALPRWVTLAVHRSGYHPADRFERLQLIVAARNFRIGDAGLSATHFEVNEIGHLTDQRTLSASASGAPAAGASVAAGATRSETFERDLRARFQDQDLTVGSRSLKLYREGAPGRDLTGAVALPLTLLAVRPDEVAERRVIVGFTPPRGRLRGTVAVGRLRFISGGGPLYVCGKIRYVERRVIAGERFFEEARQTAVIAEGETPWIPFALAAVDDLRPPLWRIARGGDPLRFAVDGVEVSAFLTRADADAALAWARSASSARKLAAGVRLGSAPFAPGDGTLQIELVPDDPPGAVPSDAGS